MPRYGTSVWMPMQLCCQELAAWGATNSPTRLAQAARQHLLLYCELNQSATKNWAWNLFPKHHLFIHLAEECVVNPRLEWHYMGEGAIGEAAQLAGNTNCRHVPSQVVELYRLTFTRVSYGRKTGTHHHHMSQ